MGCRRLEIQRVSDELLNFEPVHNGEWREYEVKFTSQGALKQIRIDPSTAPELIEIDWVQLVDEGGQLLKEWEFE